MKVCGIDIKENKVRFIILEKKDEIDEIVESNTNFFELKDASSPQEVQQFKDILYSFFDHHNFDKIGILARNSSGRYSSHGTSFKIEGILQLYNRKHIELYSNATINAFLKKNTSELNPQNRNQAKAFNLAHFLMNQN